ncbi:MAG: acyl-CoA thioesterase II [Hyphomicrobiales bacterium]|nr:acyl-CoA thioesterase II [Hyphomicrobiales bacterium]
MVSIGDLGKILDLEQLEVNLFRGYSPANGQKRVFGGQVIGQALIAATRTVETRKVHSLHCYFLLGGDPSIPIIFDVERIRDGGSFTTRRVIAIQHGRPIFSMSVSFHKDEDGFAHQTQMPETPAPDTLPSEEDLKPLLPEHMRRFWTFDRPVELRPVDFDVYAKTGKVGPVQKIWLRTKERLADDAMLHQCALAYASDFTLLNAALLHQGRPPYDPNVMMASLDHAIWFHRDFRADEWLLYVQDSPSAQGARAFCKGSIYHTDGALVASVAQEGLVRVIGQTGPA